MDVYICVKENKSLVCKEVKKLQHLERKCFPKILIGTRNGDILESTFTLDLGVFKKKLGIDEKTPKKDEEDSEEDKTRLQ